MDRAYNQEKKHKGKGECPGHCGTLADKMNQGGKYGPHSTPHELAEQMSQGSGYKQGPPAHGLGVQMGQK